MQATESGSGINRFEDGMDPRAIAVRVSELLVATADGSDALLHEAVSEVLQRLRNELEMDAAFVAEFVGGRRIFRRVDSVEGIPIIGESDRLENTFCERIVDGRLPRLIADVKQLPASVQLPDTDVPVRAHLSTPVVLADGSVYGTMCCFSARPAPALTQRDLRLLENAAQLVAREIDRRPNAA